MVRIRYWFRGLSARLVIGFGLVLAIASATTWIVAAAVGPRVFDDHLARAGLGSDSDAVIHARRAFRDASTVSMAFGLILAAAAALTVSVFLARRIGQTLREFSEATARIAAGERATVAPSMGVGEEFDHLANDFNRMARDLEAAETTRRRLISDVAHELRTPVATITGYLDSIEDGIRAFDDEAIRILRSSADRLTRLASDLAALSRAEADPSVIQRERLDVATVLSAAVASHQVAYGAKRVHLSLKDPDRVEILADRDRLSQVMANLLDNALRHTSRGGRVDITSTSSDTAVTIVIADTGDGIGAEHLPHVFDRFYRTDSARDRDHGGSGIGLAIVRGIVEAHGGTVSAESDGPGSGAQFTVVLPRANGGQGS